MNDPLPTRTRSYGGCGTCRSRHVKCDETRPTCQTCASFNLVCEGYTRTLFFDVKDGDDDGGKNRYRQILFTDEERKQMNLLMTKNVPLRRALAVVAEIENKCEEAINSSQREIDIFRGPFGAFKLESTPSSDEFGPLTLAHLRSDSPTLELSDPEVFQMPEWLEASLFDSFLPKNDFPPHLHKPLMDPLWPTIGNSILQEAPLLLKHYANNVIPSLTPFRHAKTPWHILFLPSAKNTLAGIAIGEEVDAAQLTIFYGLLSISATHLYYHSSSSKWQTQANTLRQKAAENIQAVLVRGLELPKAFKYKSTLMALLTMVQISMTEGTWNQTDLFLLETEKMIRLRGLTKQVKSRKVRLLHHCYAYVRLFHESMTLNPSRLQTRLAIMDVVQSSGLAPKGSDAPLFRLTPWDDLDAKFQEIKTREHGENDLHLCSPGFWANTLYPEIFGIPETWLTLLSQIIRLGNEKESDDGTLSLRGFTDRSKALERYILRWDGAIFPAISIDKMEVVDADWILLEGMQNAMRHALIIYFYRRIHDIDPELLQHQVEKVKDALFTCKQLCHISGSLDPLMWPAFIAGCEALHEELQNAFSEWFDYCMQHSRQTSFARMHQLMHCVWDLRRSDDKKLTSWLHLLKENDMIL